MKEQIKKLIAEGKQHVRSWGDTHNANYWFDQGRLEALEEVYRLICEEEKA